MIGDKKGVLHYWSLEGQLRTSDGALIAWNMAGKQFSPNGNGKMLVATYQGKTLADASAALWNTDDWTAQTISGYGSAAFSHDSPTASARWKNRLFRAFTA